MTTLFLLQVDRHSAMERAGGKAFWSGWVTHVNGRPVENAQQIDSIAMARDKVSLTFHREAVVQPCPKHRLT
eukprot:gene6056-3062_t